MSREQMNTDDFDDGVSESNESEVSTRSTSSTYTDETITTEGERVGGPVSEHTRDEELEDYSVESAMRHSMHTLQLQDADNLNRALQESTLAEEADLAEAMRLSRQELDPRQLESELLERALRSSCAVAPKYQRSDSGQHQQNPMQAASNSRFPSSYEEYRSRRPGSLDPRVPRPSLQRSVQQSDEAISAEYRRSGLRRTSPTPSIVTIGRATTQQEAQEAARQDLYQRRRRASSSVQTDNIYAHEQGASGTHDGLAYGRKISESESGDGSDSSSEASTVVGNNVP
ncbi:hypothetical protein MBLNU230_g0935t1 [Neophaeotheca triangularis]